MGLCYLALISADRVVDVAFISANMAVYAALISVNRAVYLAFISADRGVYVPSHAVSCWHARVFHYGAAPSPQRSHQKVQHVRLAAPNS